MPSGIKQVFASKLTDVDTIKRDILGDIRFEGNKAYKYVDFINSDETIAGVAGDLVVYYAEAGTGYVLNKVSLDYDDGDAVPICGGMLVAAVPGTSATHYYLWVQIRGYATLSATPVSGAAGKEFVKTSNADKTATLKADDTTPACGIQLGATDGTCILRCEF